MKGFNDLSNRFPLNVYLLTNIATVCSYSKRDADMTESIQIFKKVRTLDKFSTRGMDIFGSLLYRAGESAEMPILSSDLMTINRSDATLMNARFNNRFALNPFPEAWIVAAYFSEHKREGDRALEFIDRVFTFSCFIPLKVYV